MERSEAIAKLKQHEAELRRLGIEHLYLFGSTARDEAREDSDIDLFFDHPEGSLGIFELMEVKEAAARILGRKTDIMTRRSLHPVLRERIEASALQVFEWRCVSDRTPHGCHRGRRADRSEIASATLRSFEPDKRKRWLLERALKSSPRPAGI